MKNSFSGHFLSKLRRHCGYAMPRIGRVGYNIFERIIPDNIETELFPGIVASMDMTDQVQKELFYHGGRSEPFLMRGLLTLCSDKGVDTFLDIGANYGFYSYLLTSRFPKLTVHSFEPNPSNFDNIARIKALNNLHNLHPWNCGLGSTNACIGFYVDKHNSGNCSFVSRHPNRPEGVTDSAEDVDVMTFDSWLTSSRNTFQKNTLVAKIDVEGYETEVVLGMAESLSRKLFQALVIEVFPEALKCAGTSAETLFVQMAKYGYVPYSEESMERIAHPPSCGNVNVVFLPE